MDILPKRIDEAAYLAIDPGETIGWATFLEDGNMLEMGQFRFENFTEVSDKMIVSTLKHVITEQYVNYGHKQQKRWSKNNTSKVIGKIELMCDLRKVPLTMQPATNYRTGAAWGGFDIPKNHSISHQFVACAHGVYFLQQNGIRPVGQALLEKKNGS